MPSSSCYLLKKVYMTIRISCQSLFQFVRFALLEEIEFMDDLVGKVVWDIIGVCDLFLQLLDLHFELDKFFPSGPLHIHATHLFDSIHDQFRKVPSWVVATRILDTFLVLCRLLQVRWELFEIYLFLITLAKDGLEGDVGLLLFSRLSHMLTFADRQ